jgi:hypothetical protein
MKMPGIMTPLYSVILGSDGGSLLIMILLLGPEYPNTNPPYSDSEDGGFVCLRNIGITVHVQTMQRPKNRISINDYIYFNS